MLHVPRKVFILVMMAGHAKVWTVPQLIKNQYRLKEPVQCDMWCRSKAWTSQRFNMKPLSIVLSKQP